MSDMYYCFVDGSFRPGTIRRSVGIGSYGFAIYKANDDTKPIIKDHGRILAATSNQAEYLAVIEALRYLLSNKMLNVKLYTDSKLVAEQLSKKFRINDPNLAALADIAWDLFSRFNSIEINHVDRKNNMAAHKLTQEAYNGRE